MAQTDIVDGNTKLILGMIWSLIKRHTIADISSVSLSRCPLVATTHALTS